MFDDVEGSPVFPGELEAALTAALANATQSLEILHATLRRHVHNERRKGVSLSAIGLEMRFLIERIEEAVQHGNQTHAPDGELSRQISTWNRKFYEHQVPGLTSN